MSQEVDLLCLKDGFIGSQGQEFVEIHASEIEAGKVGPPCRKHLGQKEPGLVPGSLSETVMSNNTSADQRPSSCLRS